MSSLKVQNQYSIYLIIIIQGWFFNNNEMYSFHFLPVTSVKDINHPNQKINLIV